MEQIRNTQEEMRTHTDKMDAETKTIEARTKAIRDKLDAHQEKTETGPKLRETENKTDLEETEAMNFEANPEKMEPNPEIMQSKMEHREVRTEEAVVKSAGTMKKRHMDWHLPSGQRGEPKELTRGICESRRKLAAACRMMSCRAAVARRKRNVFRKIRTQGNFGPYIIRKHQVLRRSADKSLAL
jgi:hypothetical protein